MEQSQKRLALGIFLIAIGVLFLLRNLDIIDLPRYFYSWQMLLIGIGAFNFITGNRAAGFILTAIGGVFLLPDIMQFNFSDLWPIILIIIGASFFFRNRKRADDGEQLDVDSIDEIAVFGGGERYITSQNFRGGKVTAIFGGHTIDLGKVKMAPGAQSIEVFNMFGGTNIKVPESWVVKSEVTPILGGYSDKRKNFATSGDESLIIKGTVIFGGIELSN